MIKQLGYDVDVLYGTCDVNTINLLEDEGITCIQIPNIQEEYYGKVNKLKGWMTFRKELKKFLKKYNDSEVIYWFGTAETVIPMKGLLKNKKYVVTLLELLDASKLKRMLLHGILEKALKIAVCEETRAYILQYWYKLKELPTVFPNKPYNQLTEARSLPTTDLTMKIIDEIKNDEIIIYQGYLQNTEELLEIAYALKECSKKYKLVLMGMDSFNSYSKIKEVYDNCVFYDYVPAPTHLEITSYAKIGILFYRPTELNKAFCAPNKIFEYSGFGIPMIGNNIPGLKNTIGLAGAGECIELKKDKIIEAINKIENNYDKYQKNALDFFKSVDNCETMKNFLDTIKNI